jgi:hypothetical protein|nr:MAG TPA: Major capsid protein [Caudoviricetes sp.]
MSYKDYTTVPSTRGALATDAITDAKRTELARAQILAAVEQDIAANSILAGKVNSQKVVGGNRVQSFKVDGGKVEGHNSTTGKFVQGSAITVDDTVAKIDQISILRTSVPFLDGKQSPFAHEAVISERIQGLMGAYIDEVYALHAAKVATSATGLKHTLPAAKTKENLLEGLNSISGMIWEASRRGVQGAVVLMSPRTFTTLRMNEQVLNREYLLSDGTTAAMDYLKLFGMDVYGMSNFASVAQNLTNHNMPELNGDYSKVEMIVVPRDAILAGDHGEPQVKIWDDEEKLVTFYDVRYAFGAGIKNKNRVGVVLAK